MSTLRARGDGQEEEQARTALTISFSCDCVCSAALPSISFCSASCVFRSSPTAASISFPIVAPTADVMMPRG